MSESASTTKTKSAETNGQSESNGHGRTGTVVRAAALAAASGATALAAKKAFGGGSSKSGGDSGGGGGKKGSDALLTTFLSSGWDSARDTIVPMLEDAATQAGEFVARNAPELVSETIVPQFIRGFERAQQSSSDDE